MFERSWKGVEGKRNNYKREETEISLDITITLTKEYSISQSRKEEKPQREKCFTDYLVKTMEIEKGEILTNNIIFPKFGFIVLNFLLNPMCPSQQPSGSRRLCPTSLLFMGNTHDFYYYYLL